MAQGTCDGPQIRQRRVHGYRALMPNDVDAGFDRLEGRGGYLLGHAAQQLVVVTMLTYAWRRKRGS
jgi:hypothetical protein